MPFLGMETRTGQKTLFYEFWDGQRLRSTRECPAAFDAETEWIDDPREIPRLALAAVSDGRTHFVVHPDRLADFLPAHRDGHFVGHNVAFDFAVVDRHLNGRGETRAGRVLWDACDRNRLFDTMILDMLLQLATGRFRHAAGGKGGETKIYPGGLADVAAGYVGLRVDKDDPYRRRFGELVGAPFEGWAATDPGFFAYAVRDAAATRRLYPALADAAYRVMAANGHDPGAERYDICPDALERFGYLSENIQVKASVVLAYMFRRGVRIDVQKARARGEISVGDG